MEQVGANPGGADSECELNTPEQNGDGQGREAGERRGKK